MRLIKFTFNKQLIHEFVEFGYDIYRNDSKWIPPMRAEIIDRLSPQYSFYSRDGNRQCHFMIYENGIPKGRVTAMVNSQLKDRDNVSVGTLGFFECREDYQVARNLINGALDWLKKQNIKRVWGPMDFDIWHSYRFMTKGFDLPPFYGEPYNKSYYPDFFERYGFSIKAEWDSVEITGKDILCQMMSKGAKRYQLLYDRGYRFETANMNNLDSEIEKLQQIMVKSFSDFIGFTPLSADDLIRLFKKAQYAIDPRMFLFVYNPGGDLCGFAVALLELADAIRSMKGETNLAARLRFLYNRRSVNKINFYIGGVTPEEIANRSGLGRAGFYYILNEIIKAGFETLLLTLRLKGNAAHALPGRLSPIPQKEYALYQAEL